MTFGYRGIQRVGLLERERVIDVNRAYAALLAQRGDPRAGAMADALVPADMIGILDKRKVSARAVRVN